MRQIAKLMGSFGVVALTAGCLGSGGGGAGGGGAGGPGIGDCGVAGSDFAGECNRVANLVATTDMPTRLKADYEGRLQVEVAEPGGGGEKAIVEGDVAIGVDWTDGQDANPFSGTASNFVATQGGSVAELTGELHVDPAGPATLARVDIPGTDVGGHTVPAMQTGAFTFSMAGQLSDGDDASDVDLFFGGNFMGSGGKAMLGAVSGGLKVVGNESPDMFDAAIGGIFYAEQKPF